MTTKLLQLVPEYRDYVWGGQRLRPGTLTAEAWVVYENDRIANGPLAGKTLGEAAQELGADLLGENPVKRTGTRFPVLIKLLDCNEWLSVQVHPNDEQAAQMEGPDQFGKTEAWYILEAQADAKWWRACARAPRPTRWRSLCATAPSPITWNITPFIPAVPSSCPPGRCTR